MRRFALALLASLALTGCGRVDSGSIPTAAPTAGEATTAPTTEETTAAPPTAAPAAEATADASPTAAPTSEEPNVTQPPADQSTPAQNATTPPRPQGTVELAPATPISTEQAGAAVSLPAGAPVPAPLPPPLDKLVADARLDLAQRSNVAPDTVEVAEVLAVTWPDGSLGCPREGMNYPQVQVDGVLVRLRAGGQLFDYHGDGQKALFLCEGKKRP